MPFKTEINKLNNMFEEIKTQVDNGMIYLFAQFKVEKLIQIAEPKYKLWSNLPNMDEEILAEFKSLISQARQYLEDLIDLIQIEKNSL